ncbi:hypothetical protein PLICRDRAFT_177086 [Plicaturopsis crispa FD-325 SS-3]|nr:hypothetical protein PLICRDRAFT_177086 [Plicaturopsis crispa FD-325 SS-3]
MHLTDRPEQEPDELVRFREAWKAEVQRKRAAASGDAPLQASASTSTSDNAPSSSQGPAGDAPVVSPQIPKLAASSSQVAWSEPATVHTSHGVSSVPVKFRPAVELYRRAVLHEQRGEVDDALQLYQKAFRLYDQVDVAYRQQEQEQHRALLASGQIVDPPKARPRPVSGPPVIDEIAQDLSKISLKRATGPSVLTTGTFENVLASFPDRLSFEPEEEGEKTPISILPDEILVSILRTLDHGTIERFATVNRKARVVSLDSVIWKDFVEAVYKPPQVPDEETAAAVINRHSLDYRRVYIEQPRVRYDGVYIAVCHYLRQGMSENAWVNISHFITYHRYLRFLPDGQVLSLLANDEADPQEVVPQLKPALRMKGLLIGTWQLLGTTVHVTNLVDASGRYPYPPHPDSDSNNASRYTFQMTLALRSRPLGRWNKLDFIGYDSVDRLNGDVVPLALKHAKPYWFSKVRSWVS